MTRWGEETRRGQRAVYVWRCRHQRAVTYLHRIVDNETCTHVHIHAQRIQGGAKTTTNHHPLPKETADRTRIQHTRPPFVQMPCSHVMILSLHCVVYSPCSNASDITSAPPVLIVPYSKWTVLGQLSIPVRSIRCQFLKFSRSNCFLLPIRSEL